MDEEHAIVIDDDMGLANKDALSPVRSDDFEEKHPIPSRPTKSSSTASGALVKFSLMGAKRPNLVAGACRASNLPQPMRLPAVRFVPVEWPRNIVHLMAHFNPDAISLPRVDHFGSCQCKTRCRFDTCPNALLGIFCAENCCPFDGYCGNGLASSQDLVLARDTQAKSFTLLARRTIPKGVVLGQYLGRITLAPPPKERKHNRGFRLVMHTGPPNCGTWRMCIDAEELGSMLRFANHSCNPCAAFYELSNGTVHTVVAATEREVHAGEEVTVDYGKELWFICRCGAANCRHRHIRHGED